MGNHFEITVACEHQEDADYFIEMAILEIRRIESLLTTFRPDSQTNKINQNAGIQPVYVDKEVFDLIARAMKISSLTQGAFDITYGSIDKKFWNFDTTMTSLPDKESAKKSVRLINYRNVRLNNNESTVYLSEKGMRIGFGGIGKGYAAECAKNLLKNQGVTAGIINASGDLCTWGKDPNGSNWSIGIVNPAVPSSIFSSIDLHEMSIATSGNYEKFVMINTKRYSHTIDPRTGFPVHGISSVSIISPNAELCDALTTPVMVMGVEAGLYLVNQLPDIGCVIIDDQNNLFTSKNIKLIQA